MFFLPPPPHPPCSVSEPPAGGIFHTVRSATRSNIPKTSSSGGIKPNLMLQYDHFHSSPSSYLSWHLGWLL